MNCGGEKVRITISKALLGAGLAVICQTPLFAQDVACDPDPQMADLDFIMQDMHGQEVSLNDYRGKVILLDFWATWCAPCRIEIPGFIELFDKYEDDGFVVLGINVDDSVPAMQAFAAELEMDYPVLVAADRDDVKDAYGPPVGYPTAFMINRAGEICMSHVGFAPKDQFEREILHLL